MSRVSCPQWFWVLVLGLLLLLNLKAWNTPLFLAIQTQTRLLPDLWWAHLTLLGDTWAALAWIAILGRYHPRLLWASLWTLLAAALLIHSSKFFFKLPRPAAVLAPEELHLIGPALYYRAFPSGHALTAFALAGLLWHSFPRFSLRLGVLLLATGIALSRIAVGAHWPQDLVAGAALGWLAARWGWGFAMRWPLDTQAAVSVGLWVLLGAAMVFFLGHDPEAYPGTLGLHYGLALAGLVQVLRELSHRGQRYHGS